jgi:hypothetical protein
MPIIKGELVNRTTLWYIFEAGFHYGQLEQLHRDNPEVGMSFDHHVDEYVDDWLAQHCPEIKEIDPS